MQRFGEAHEAGVLVGDVVCTINGRPLPPRRTLAEVLRADFVLVGDGLRLGLRRSLEAHMEERTRVLFAAGRPASHVQPSSPRMYPDRLPRRLLNADEGARRAAFVANPNARPRRDPYNDQLVSRSQWALGGSMGRML